MKVETERFGAVEVAEEAILTFPEGFPGFEGKQFALLANEAPGIEWLVSLADPKVALMVVDPTQFRIEYDPRPKDAEILPIDPDDGKLGIRIVVRAGDEPGRVFLNLFAPILINFSKRLAMQVPLVGSGHQVREPWPPS